MIWCCKEYSDFKNHKMSAEYYKTKMIEAEKIYNDKKTLLVEEIKSECIKQNLTYSEGLIPLIETYSQIPYHSAIYPPVSYVIQQIKKDLDSYKTGTFNQEMKEIINSSDESSDNK